MSQAALERVPRRDDPERQRLWRGISVYDNEQRARVVALRYPRLGPYIAELSVEEGGLESERTTLSAGHYTLWGDPSAILGCVKRVVEVSELGGPR